MFTSDGCVSDESYVHSQMTLKNHCAFIQLTAIDCSSALGIVQGSIHQSDLHQYLLLKGDGCNYKCFADSQRQHSVSILLLGLSSTKDVDSLLLWFKIHFLCYLLEAGTEYQCHFQHVVFIADLAHQSSTSVIDKAAEEPLGLLF